MTLKAKADETTKHIEKLVSKQKVTNKKKYAVHRTRGRGGGGPGGRQFYGQRFQAPLPQQRYSRPMPPHMTPRPPMVPAYIRRQLVELFKSFPDGLYLSQLDSAFSRLFGTGINYRTFGFPDQYELLRSIPEDVRLEKTNYDWKLIPVYPRQELTRHVYNRGSAEVPSYSSPARNVQSSGGQTSGATSLPTSPNAAGDGTSRPSKGRGEIMGYYYLLVIINMKIGFTLLIAFMFMFYILWGF